MPVALRATALRAVATKPSKKPGLLPRRSAPRRAAPHRGASRRGAPRRTVAFALWPGLGKVAETFLIFWLKPIFVPRSIFQLPGFFLGKSSFLEHLVLRYFFLVWSRQMGLRLIMLKNKKFQKH